MSLEELQVGQLVLSWAGKDKGRHFLILKIDGAFVYLADGDLRKVSRAKRKNIKHVRPLRQVSPQIAQKIQRGLRLTDQEVKEAISQMAPKREGGNQETGENGTARCN